MQRRVVVTGVGLLSSVGIGTETCWEALCAGRSGIGPITNFDAAQFASRIAVRNPSFSSSMRQRSKSPKRSRTGNCMPHSLWY